MICSRTRTKNSLSPSCLIISVFILRCAVVVSILQENEVARNQRWPQMTGSGNTAQSGTQFVGLPAPPVPARNARLCFLGVLYCCYVVLPHALEHPRGGCGGNRAAAAGVSLWVATACLCSRIDVAIGWSGRAGAPTGAARMAAIASRYGRVCCWIAIRIRLLPGHA